MCRFRLTLFFWLFGTVLLGGPFLSGPLFSGSLSSSFGQAQAQQAGNLVEQIEITGNSRVSVNTILAYLPVKLGQQMSAELLDASIDRLFATRLFSDVQIEQQDGRLIIQVVENPIVNRVNIEGNDVLSDERLQAELDIQPRRIYTRQLALEGAERLLQIYRLSGRYGATVEPKIIRLENNRVDLVFEVDEGPLIKISSIKFSGNQAFSDRALRQVISSRVQRWWAFLSATDKYDEGRLDYDVRLLRQFYLSRGYADIVVDRVQGGLLPDRSGFAVVFQITEGPLYELGQITINSAIEGVDTEALRSLIPMQAGDRYDVRRLEQGLLSMTNELGNFGYAFVNLTPEITTDPAAGQLDIAIGIGKAQRNYVERINIIDNSRTLDRVIRREMELVEGDAFNSLKLEKSLRKLRNLGYFSSVTNRNLQGSAPEQTIIEVAVEEQSTGELSVGIGYSSIDKTSFSFGINERNFLGTGRRLNLSTALSDNRSDLRIGLTEPYFLGRNLSAGAEIFKEETKETTVTVESYGANFSLGFSAANDIYHRIIYSLEEKNSTESSSNATSETGENGQTLLASALTYRLGIDKRDNRFDPTSGYFAEIRETFSGLGGDVTYLKTELRGAWYKPFYFNQLIVGARGRIGFVDGLGEKVTQSSRFYLGGRNVRGFDGGGIGPIDTGTKTAVGGNQIYNGSLEIVSTLGLNKDTGLRWTAYTDFGSVWGVDYPGGVTGPEDDKLRQSVGVGLLWDTAIGPLSFYWADAVSKTSFDKTKRFQFSLGARL